MKIHLKTLCVVLSTFSGALFSFVAFDHPLGLVFSKWISFVSSFDSFFPIEIPESKTTLTRNARASLLLPRVGYKTTERRKSSTSTWATRRRRQFCDAKNSRWPNTRRSGQRRISWSLCTKGKCWKTRKRWKRRRLRRMVSW